MVSMQIGFLGIGTFFVYILGYWFIREPMKKLYYKLDKHRIDFERTAEMEELLEEEAEVRHMVNEDDSTATPTPNYIGSNLSSREAVLEKGFKTAQWKLEQAEKPTKKQLRKMQEAMENESSTPARKTTPSSSEEQVINQKSLDKPDVTVPPRPY